jgi:hypothetical protein
VPTTPILDIDLGIRESLDVSSITVGAMTFEAD